MTRTFLILALALPGLTACQDHSSDADFRFVSLNAHHDLDPQKISWSHDIRVAQCLFEPLLRVRPEDLQLEPGTADHWAATPDGLTYTFRIRPTARWSNGDPVTANDFIFAWRRAMLPDLAADYSQLMFCIDGAETFFHWRNDQLTQYLARDPARKNPQAAQDLWIQAQHRFATTVGLSSPQPDTLVVRLARPTPYFPQLCAFVTFMPVHAATLEPATTLNPDTGMLTQDPTWLRPDRLVTNGPYTMKRWRFKQDLLLTANPHYWDRASVANASILEIILASPQTALLRYQNKEIDWLPDIPTTQPVAADLIRSQRTDVHVTPAAGTYFYNFNCNPRLADGSPNPLADARVRRALSMTIDRQTIVDKVTRLGSKQPVALTFVPPAALPQYHPPTDAGVRFDPQQATALLREAGYASGADLTGLSILYNTEGGHASIAQQVRFSWKTHLGVDVKLEAVESKRFSQRLKNQDYTICRASWFGDYQDPTTFLDKFLTANGNNDTAWNSPRYDQIMEQAAREADPGRRLQTLSRAEAMMLHEQPIAPIYHYVFFWVYDPNRVHGLVQNAWNIPRLSQVRVQH